MIDQTEDNKISIIVPTYNSQNLICKCIESICSQTYSNLEIIIVDDGSTDETISKCEEMARQDHRIKVIANRHGGVSKTRNKGLEIVTGKYVTFVDSDDFIEPNLLEEYINSIELFEKDGYISAFVMSGMQVDVYCGTMNNESQILENMGERLLLERNQIAYLCYKKLFNFITNKMYSMHAIKANNLKFRDEIQNGEDLKFNLDYLKAVKGDIVMINKPLYHYVRVVEKSLSLVFYEKAIEHTKAVYRELIDFTSNQDGVTDEDILTVKAIFLVDWTSRLTALYERSNWYSKDRVVGGKKNIKSELNTLEFQNLLEEVYSCKKISTLKYYILKYKNYNIYILLRFFYRIFKKA